MYSAIHLYTALLHGYIACKYHRKYAKYCSTAKYQYSAHLHVNRIASIGVQSTAHGVSKHRSMLCEEGITHEVIFTPRGEVTSLPRRRR